MTKNEVVSQRILVADDDPVIVRLVSTIVRGEGFSVVTAKDGKEAYKLLSSSEDIGGVILDLKMPYIEGTDIVKFMQSDGRLKNVPVIMMTGAIDSKLSSSGFAAGAAAFLPKPFTNDQLKLMIKTFIKRIAAVK